jgi:hypothetical protein
MLPEEEAPAEEVPTLFEEVTPEGELSLKVSPIGEGETLPEEEAIPEETPAEVT